MAHGLNAFKCGFLAFIGQGYSFCPAGLDIHDVERMQELSCCGLTAMSHKVHLNEARSLLVPIGEGADRDGVFEQGAGFGCASTTISQFAPGALQAAIDR